MERMFALARSVALPQDRRNYWFGAAGIRKDGTIVVARNIPAIDETVHAHAETRVAKKGAKEIWVAKISRVSGKFMPSRPCKRCMKEMHNRGVKKIHFMNIHGEFVNEQI